MGIIEHFDGSSTSIDQEADGSWNVVTTNADGNPGGTQSYGSNFAAQEMMDKFTYANDVVDSSSIEHDDGSRTVIDQLGGGGWSVYSVDAGGNQSPSTEYGSNYTREELAASVAAAGDQEYNADPPQPIDSTPLPEPPPEQEESPSEGGPASEGEEGEAEGGGGEGGRGDAGGGG